MTPKIIENMKKSFEEASELDGYEDLTDADKGKIDTAWVDGKVADEDIPATARKADGAADGDDDDEEKPKKAKAAAPRKKKAADGDAEEKPKQKRTTKAKVGFLMRGEYRL